MDIAIEAKGTDRIVGDHLKGLRTLGESFPHVKEKIVVCLEKHIRKTEDNIWILPYTDFVKRLWANPLRHDVVVSSTVIAQTDK